MVLVCVVVEDIVDSVVVVMYSVVYALPESRC